MKTCTKCGVEKQDADYHYLYKAKGIRKPSCKECCSNHHKGYYQANHKRYTDYNRERKRRNQQFVRDYLKEHPCLDCGESDPVVLDFDHLRDKIKDISYLASRQFSIATIQKEIEKCEVVCSNCHRRRTADRAGWYKDLV